MNLSQVKTALSHLDQLNFQLPNGESVPAHFHVTEIGHSQKKFVDCGGTFREEKRVNFQLWSSTDFDHRLHPEKLSKIIELSEQQLGASNAEIEVEFQGQTIEKYALDFDGEHFLLVPQETDCLAKDQCGIPQPKKKVQLSELQNRSECNPNSGCC